ncbi:MAG: HlyC/CorC family transporter [Myxococcales bacterium]|nr:HlyC/CorC family transporter [Myxococcales bacterium]MCB9524451.1 HlyC/CorC family transporter [Myxococcales bacterium]
MIELGLAVLLVLVSSAICSGTEAALFSMPLLKARNLAESGGKSAKALLAIREDIRRPIATIVVLNNIANIVGSILVGNLAAHVLGESWLGVFSGVLTFMVIVFSEIVPKTLGERNAQWVCLHTARPLTVVVTLLSPIVWLIEQITPERSGDAEPTTNEAEIRMLTRIARQEGVIEGDESEMIHRVFALNDRTARDIMTPRVNITWLEADETLAEQKEDILASQHSRMVVTGETVDEVVGIALKAELLRALVEEQGELPVRTWARAPRFVRQDARADRLLQVFQRTHEHLMIVADDFGGVAGVVSLEDVLEVLTGEIVDETDTVVDLAEDARRNQDKLLEQV